MPRGLLEQRRKLWREQLEEIKRIVYDFVEVLRSHGIVVEEVYLFGSRARGDFSRESDVDLVIVSSSWKDLPIYRRLGLLYRLWSYGYDATFYPLTREELRVKIKRSIVLRDARRYWIKLYP